MMVYIGAPIDSARQAPDGPLRELGQAVVEAIPDAVVFNPFTAWMNAAQVHHDSICHIWNVNDHALMAADIAVFGWTGCPSVGVPIEIYRRHSSGKDFVVVNFTQKQNPGLYLRHLCGPRLLQTPEQLITWLREWAGGYNGDAD